ncbi:hypothetical protein VTO73DRAFT_5296 [Trametes versicolor]
MCGAATWDRIEKHASIVMRYAANVTRVSAQAFFHFPHRDAHTAFQYLPASAPVQKLPSKVMALLTGAHHSALSTSAIPMLMYDTVHRSTLH